MLRGASAPNSDDEFQAHDDRTAPGADLLDHARALDNVVLTTVGVDVGSSTSHLLFARLHLQRQTRSHSSRFVVIDRQVLHRSPIQLTPYRADGLIDIETLERFVLASYADAGLTRDDIDTGAVILTGAAVERANARAAADLFAHEGGKFVCASAGHNMEGILAAKGSGAAALSHARGETLLHIDVGGGTTKPVLLRGGEVLQTSAIHVGGRLVVVDADDRVTRIEPSAAIAARWLGLHLALGERFGAEDRQRLANALADVLVDSLTGAEPSDLGRAFLLTQPLALDGLMPAGVTFSGGVAEYIYEREAAYYGDLGRDLAGAIRRAAADGRLPAPILPLGEGIRATVLGASQYGVQLSGNTVYISDPSVLPLRNLPVVYARLPDEGVSADALAEAIRQGFVRLDLTEGEAPVAVAVAWQGAPDYAALREIAAGIARGVSGWLAGGVPIVLALDADIGASLGGILAEEFAVSSPLISIDGLQLVELDFVDIGSIIQPANVVPVVVKSLAFPTVGETPSGSGS